jgi:hypothetical protein
MLLLRLMFSPALLFCSLLLLFVSHNNRTGRKFVAIRHNGCGLDEYVTTHLPEEATLAGLVDGLQNVRSRSRFAEVSNGCHRRVDTSFLVAQHTTSCRI